MAFKPAQQTSGRFVPATDREEEAPADESPLVSQIPVEESVKAPEQRQARAAAPRAEPPSLGERVIQNLYGITVVAGGARLASL